MGRTSDAKERLLEAALHLIWERSYGDVTIDNICETAKVKKGSFYYFFNSKSELAVAALQDNWTNNGRAKWDAMFSPSMPPLERIRTFMKSVHDSQEEVQKEYGRVLGCPCFCLGTEVSTQDDALLGVAQEILRKQLCYFESAIRDAQAEGSVGPGNANMKARCLFALFEGSLAQARIQNDLEILSSLSNASMDLLGVPTTAPAVEPATVTV
ncbi:MAG TPA: TetR/AcrR family transcriptional regulator [Candidatus Saccharimonadia bacterium]|nr:TetR/AcrR family transcriptional regulator [Candidatus Saccharimonadia bacterium]